MAIKVDRPKTPRRTSTKEGEPAAKPTPKAAIYGRLHQDGDLIEVPVSQISANPFNDREMSGLEDMAASIRVNGLLSPVTLIETEAFTKLYPQYAEEITTKYVLGPGEHRWRACMLAEQPTIRGFLRNDLAPKIKAILVLENLRRTNPSPMELARQIGRIRDEDGLSIREIAEEIGGGSTNIHRHLELLKLPEEIQGAVQSGDLLPTHARALLALEDGERMVQAWKLMQQQDLKVRSAIQRILAGEVPDLEEPDAAGSPEPAAGAGPEEPDGGSAETADGPKTPDKPETTNGSEPVPQPRDAGAAKRPVREAAPRTDTSAAERAAAAADRESACVEFLRTGAAIGHENLMIAVARTLLAAGQQEAARVRAHAWLREAGTAGLDVVDAASYHQAVLSSGNAELIERVVLAMALAAAELRAADRRRPRWDAQDAAHVHFLTEHAGYVPARTWELAELERLGVGSAVPGGNS